MTEITEKHLRHFYLRSCKGKQNHADPIWALVESMRAYKKFGESLFVYKCRFCPNYHLGHIQARVREFIQDLIGPKATVRLTYTIADTLSGATLKQLRPRSGAMSTTVE